MPKQISNITGPCSKVVSAVAATEKEEMMAGSTRHGKIPLCFSIVELTVSELLNSTDRKSVYFT